MIKGMRNVWNKFSLFSNNLLSISEALVVEVKRSHYEEW